MGKYIKVFNKSDKAVFNGFKNCGHLNSDHMKKLGVSDTKIKNYCKEGLVKKVSYKSGGEKENKLCYKLTDKGREFAESKWGYKTFTQATVNHERHNLAVADKFCSLTPKEQLSVLNERELREVVQQVIYNMEQQQERDQAQELLDQGKLSMPDIVYTTEQGQTIGFETVTNSYGVEEIQAKIDTCEFLKIDYEQRNI